MDKEDAIWKLRSLFSDMKDYRFHGCCSHFPEEIGDYASYLNKASQFTFYETGNGFYLGQERNGKRNGFGYYYWNKDETVYSGDWRDNERTGEGLYYSNGYFYHGGFLNGNNHGHGCSRGSNGIEIEADYVNGERTNVWNGSDDFIDDKGRHYNRKNNFRGEKELGCGGIIFIAIVIIIMMKMCS